MRKTPLDPRRRQSPQNSQIIRKNHKMERHRQNDVIRLFPPKSNGQTMPLKVPFNPTKIFQPSRFINSSLGMDLRRGAHALVNALVIWQPMDPDGIVHQGQVILP